LKLIENGHFKKIPIINTFGDIRNGTRPIGDKGFSISKMLIVLMEKKTICQSKLSTFVIGAHLILYTQIYIVLFDKGSQPFLFTRAICFIDLCKPDYLCHPIEQLMKVLLSVYISSLTMANSPVNRTSFIFLQTGEERSGGVRRLC
jgi:hypothetical protein